MTRHLAVFQKSAIEAILSGTKQIDLRFFNTRVDPFLTVKVGDLVYIKSASGSIVGQFVVKKLIFLEVLDLESRSIIDSFWSRISLGSALEDKKFLSAHKHAKFAALIFFDTVETLITSPIKIIKHDRRSWIKL